MTFSRGGGGEGGGEPPDTPQGQRPQEQQHTIPYRFYGMLYGR